MCIHHSVPVDLIWQKVKEQLPNLTEEQLTAARQIYDRRTLEVLSREMLFVNSVVEWLVKDIRRDKN